MINVTLEEKQPVRTNDSRVIVVLCCRNKRAYKTIVEEKRINADLC